MLTTEMVRNHCIKGREVLLIQEPGVFHVILCAQWYFSQEIT